MDGQHLTGLFILLGTLAGLKIVLDQWVFDKRRERRRTYYRDTCLTSDDWKRKRALVLKRDGYRCVFSCKLIGIFTIWIVAYSPE